jgi:hypothetical protein
MRLCVCTPLVSTGEILTFYYDPLYLGMEHTGVHMKKRRSICTGVFDNESPEPVRYFAVELPHITEQYVQEW